MARIRGLKANEIGSLLTLTVSCGDETGSLHYSALSYCHDAFSGNYGDAFKNAVRALYLYYLRATEYKTGA